MSIDKEIPVDLWMIAQLARQLDINVRGIDVAEIRLSGEHAVVINNMTDLRYYKFTEKLSEAGNVIRRYIKTAAV